MLNMGGQMLGEGAHAHAGLVVYLRGHPFAEVEGDLLSSRFRNPELFSCGTERFSGQFLYGDLFVALFKHIYPKNYFTATSL